MPDEIEIAVEHPVPVLWAPRPGSAWRLWFHHVVTPVTLHPIPPGTMEPLRARFGDGDPLEAFGHDGRVWRRFEVLDDRFKPVGPAPVAQVAEILAGAGPVHNSRSIYPCGSPLSPGEAILPDRTGIPDGRLPDRVLVKASGDLTDAARTRLRAFFAGEALHDGEAVYVAVPPPLVHAFCGGSYAAPLAAVPGSGFGWFGSAGSPARLDPYLDVVRALHGEAQAEACRATAAALAPFAGLGDPDADVAAFLAQVPHYLWKSRNALIARHESDPAAETLRPGAEAALCRLRPLAARASVGLLVPADYVETAEASHALAVALAALYPNHGLRDRFEEIARFVEIVVGPRLRERDAGAAEDAVALAGLAP